MHTRGNNYLDLIHCRIVEGLIIFALPMIAGDLLQIMSGDVVGTGLGLSICKEILKKHDFAFGVTSTEGVGSTFWFEIPTVAEKKHPKRQPKEKRTEQPEKQTPPKEK